MLGSLSCMFNLFIFTIIYAIVLVSYCVVICNLSIRVSIVSLYVKIIKKSENKLQLYVNYFKKESYTTLPIHIVEQSDIK